MQRLRHCLFNCLLRCDTKSDANCMNPGSEFDFGPILAILFSFCRIVITVDFSLLIPIV